MTEPQNKILRISEADDVGIALVALVPGDRLRFAASDEDEIEVVDRIPRDRKIALRPIEAASFVNKYGQVIGLAVDAIPQGAHVHSHNLSGEVMYERKSAQAHHYSATDYGDLLDELMGYARENGAVGTRTCIALPPTVNCSAKVCRAVADHFNRGDALTFGDNEFVPWQLGAIL